MRFLQYISPALLLGYSYAAAANTAEQSAVIPLTAAHFDQVVNAQPVMLVAFLLSRSVVCEALAPEYENAAEGLDGVLGIALSTVDCIDNADLCARYHVQDFPNRMASGTTETTDPGQCASLMVLRHGTIVASYEGPMTGDKIFSFMIMLRLDIPMAIKVTASDHDDVKASADVAFIAYMSSPTDASATTFSIVAEDHRFDKLAFGLCTDETAIAADGVLPPAVVAYHTFDPTETRRAVFTGQHADFTTQALKAFVRNNSVPLVGDVASVGYLHYRRIGLPLAFLFIERDDPVHAQYAETLRHVANKYRGRLTFGYTDSRRYAERFGLLDDGAWPVFAIQHRNGGLYSVVQGADVSADVLTEFVDRFVLKYKPTVPRNTVREIVGSEFDRVVFDDKKDVFLAVYTITGCTHCWRLKPTWNLLGDKYSALKDRITIARVEATSTDLPFSVAAVPWLRFKKAGTREFIDFQGERSLEALVAFVETHAANPLVAVALPSEVVASSAEGPQREFHSYQS